MLSSISFNSWSQNQKISVKKALAEQIISEGLIKEGKLDDTAVIQFCRINGMKFSEEQKGTTIIINQH